MPATTPQPRNPMLSDACQVGVALRAVLFWRP
jgi:hypothetical protein